LFLIDHSLKETMKNSSFDQGHASGSTAPLSITYHNFKALAALVLLVPATVAAQVPLPIPETLSGSAMDLTVQEGSYQFHPGETVATYGINGNLLGPTLILDKGQEVTLHVTNTLPDLTTMHWHGMHVSAANDGGPHSLIYPGTTWSPHFTVLNRAGTYWYHPHGIGLTDYQVSKGLAGMIIVRDEQEAVLALPRTYGVDDIPLVLQTKPIVAGEIMLHTGLDSVVVANGVCNAWKELPAQVVRLRCLNGTSERSFLLGLSNGMSFQVIGTDGGLLAAPVSLTRARLMPGERLELLVDLNGMQGSSFRLMCYGSELPNGILGAQQVGNGMATLDGYDQNALNGSDYSLVSFTVGSPTSDPITSVPTTLVPTDPLQVMDADITRSFNLAPQVMGPTGMIEGPFTINGVSMDMDVINVTIPLGNTEIWSFTNNTMIGHPVHIHDVEFNILDRNGAAPDAWETGWKDVVYVPAQGTTRVIMRFEDFADPDMPYMYHCHMLMHEDEGMMGQFVVVDPNSIGETGAQQGLNVWPVPAVGEIHVQVPRNAGAFSVSLFDATGRITLSDLLSAIDGPATIQVGTLAPGPYTLRITDSTGNKQVRQVIISD
jgi:bilirubin oxidase